MSEKKTPKQKKASQAEEEHIIQGYLFRTQASGSGLDEFNDCVCQVTGRVEAEGSLLSDGPMFTIRFGDGTTESASWEELHPWFPV